MAEYYPPRPLARPPRLRAQQSRRLLVAAGLVVALLLAVGVYLVTRHDPNASNTATPVVTSAPPELGDQQPSLPTSDSLGTAGSGSSSSGPPSSPGTPLPTGPAGTSTFAPAVLGLDAPELFTPGRGQYRWLEQPATPPGWPNPDMYWRDQLQWAKDLEPSRSKYNFATLEKGLATAKARGGRFGFRIMAFCPGCGENLTPAYVPRQSSGAPDWNSEGFLVAWENLMAALGARYGNDQRIGFVDVGGFGGWGEWWWEDQWGSGINQNSARRIIAAVVKAFPQRPKVMGYVSTDYANLAMSMSDSMGLRFDCVGGDIPTGLALATAHYNESWKRTPSVGEWCGSPTVTPERGVWYVKEFHFALMSNANFPFTYGQLSASGQAAFREANMIAGYRYALASLTLPKTLPPGGNFTLTSQWKNTGVTPTYDPWKVHLRLSDASGRLVWSAPLSLDLRKVLPGSLSNTSSLRLAALPGGTYTVSVRVEDSSGYYTRPLEIANAGKQADRSYRLGTIIVGTPAG